MDKLRMAALAAAVGCACVAAPAQAADGGVDPWAGKALMVERLAKPAGAAVAKWTPYKSVELKKAGETAGSASEPSFAIWNEGQERRVEFGCAGQTFAWEGLRPGASAQLEFGCSGQRYRAQLGRVMGATQVAEAQANPEAEMKESVALPARVASVPAKAVSESGAHAADVAVKASPPKSLDASSREVATVDLSAKAVAAPTSSLASLPSQASQAPGQGLASTAPSKAAIDALGARISVVAGMVEQQEARQPARAQDELPKIPAAFLRRMDAPTPSVGAGVGADGVEELRMTPSRAPAAPLFAPGSIPLIKLGSPREIPGGSAAPAESQEALPGVKPLSSVRMPPKAEPFVGDASAAEAGEIQRDDGYKGASSKGQSSEKSLDSLLYSQKKR